MSAQLNDSKKESSERQTPFVLKEMLLILQRTILWKLVEFVSENGTEQFIIITNTAEPLGKGMISPKYKDVYIARNEK